ncbi:MAG: hypothetical protein IKN74_02085 [Clostridia bacterium]|nr:hypothetical protein [Clostridia bacterium]
MGRKKKEKNKNKLKILGGRVLFFLILVVIFVIASFFIIKLVNKPAKEFVVEKDTVSFEETADGVFVREETVVVGKNYENGMVQIVSDNQKVAKDEQIFRYYSNGEEDILNKISDLKQRINQSIEDTGIYLYSSDITSLESSIDSTINKLYKQNDISKIDENMKLLEEYMDKKTEIMGNLSSDDSEIKSLTNEKNMLEQQLIAGSEIMTAPKAGVVSYRVDGYEEMFKVENDDFSYVTEDLLKQVNLKDDSLILTNTERGKIVDNFRAYLAVEMSSEKALAAMPGEKVQLRLSSTDVVDATIKQVNPVGQNKVIIIFAIKDKITDYLMYRKIQVDIIWWEYKGLKVSNSALVEEGNNTYVYRNKLGTEEKILVKVLRQNDSFSIVDNYTNDELLEMGYSEDSLKNRSQIKLYDRIVIKDK